MQYLSSIQENGERYYYGLVVPNDRFIGYPFAPVGTQWYYGTRNSTTDEENYIRYECTGTETIGGKQCLVIESDRIPRGYSVASKRYLYEDSCIFYQYLPELGEFTQLYNFNPITTWQHFPEDEKAYLWTVKNQMGDVDVELNFKEWINLQNRLYLIQWRCIYTAERAGKSLSQKSSIIENIGDMQNLFYTDQFDAKGKDAETFTGLRCFYHPDLGWYKWGTTECDYSRSVHQQEIQNFRINSREGSLIVYDPNKAICSIRLFTSEGKELFRLHPGEWDRPVPISYKGVLLYKAELDNRLEVSGKLLAH